MQSPLFGLVIVAAVPHLILGGAGIDRLIVQLPARHRIGALAYATYARATDLGNGRFLYPILGIGGPLATWAALVVALITGATGRRSSRLGRSGTTGRRTSSWRRKCWPNCDASAPSG